MFTISADGWVHQATKIPGHPAKVYSEVNSLEWFTQHSVVGRESEFHDGVPDRFLSDEREPGDPSRFSVYAAASCPFVIRESGLLIQMYSLFACCWTSGGREGNTRSTASEAEGGLFPDYSEALTPFAENTFVRLYWAINAWQGWSKTDPLAHILQHKEVAARFNYAPTACASDRYRFANARIARGDRGDDEMSEAEKALLLGLATAICGAETGADFTTPEAALQAIMDMTSNDRILTLGLINQANRIALMEQAIESLSRSGPGSDQNSVISLKMPDGSVYNVPIVAS